MGGVQLPTWHRLGSAVPPQGAPEPGHTASVTLHTQGHSSHNADQGAAAHGLFQDVVSGIFYFHWYF